MGLLLGAGMINKQPALNILILTYISMLSRLLDCLSAGFTAWGMGAVMWAIVGPSQTLVDTPGNGGTLHKLDLRIGNTDIDPLNCILYYDFLLDSTSLVFDEFSCPAKNNGKQLT